MNLQEYEIISYTDEYYEKAGHFEKGIIQGNYIKLEMIKESFLDRAKVFKRNYACIALSDDKVIGSAIGAQTTILLNAEPLEVGIGFDTKVLPLFRNKGIGKMLIKVIYNKFFETAGLSKRFMTAKSFNTAILKLVSRVITKTWFYDFVYLTIPTSVRVKKGRVQDNSQTFSISLFHREEINSDYYHQFDSGLAYFKTYKMYKLKIKNIHWLCKMAFWILKKVRTSKYSHILAENDILSFATLYNHNPQNILGINEVLLNLEANGITHLLVCCRKYDSIYKILRSNSINQYGYHIVSDFPLNKNDKLTIDARCL